MLRRFDLFNHLSLCKVTAKSEGSNSYPPLLPAPPRFFLGRRLATRLSFYRSAFSIFGLGVSRIRLISAFFGFSPFMKFGSVFFYKSRSLETFCASFVLDRGLRKVYSANILYKKKSGSYVGLRLTQRLPSRGQRTRSNGKTARDVSFPTQQ